MHTSSTHLSPELISQSSFVPQNEPGLNCGSGSLVNKSLNHSTMSEKNPDDSSDEESDNSSVRDELSTQTPCESHIPASKSRVQ
jgi:hypothetical protein